MAYRRIDELHKLGWDNTDIARGLGVKKSRLNQFIYSFLVDVDLAERLIELTTQDVYDNATHIPCKKALAVLENGYASGLSYADLNKIVGHGMRSHFFIQRYRKRKTMNKAQYESVLKSEEQIKKAAKAKWVYMDMIGQKDTQTQLIASQKIYVLQSHGLSAQEISEQTGISLNAVFDYMEQ